MSCSLNSDLTDLGDSSTRQIIASLTQRLYCRRWVDAFADVVPLRTADPSNGEVRQQFARGGMHGSQLSIGMWPKFRKRESGS